MKIRNLFAAAILGLVMVFPVFAKSQGTYKNSRNYSYDLLNSKERLTQEELDKDLDALEHLLSHAYVLYNKSVKKGFKMDTFLNEIRKECPATEQGLYKQRDLAQAIYKASAKYFPFPDSHLSLVLGNDFVPVFNLHRVCFSDVYFEKIGKTYVVDSSSDDRIKVGSKFKGKKENLYKCITSSGERYRFGVMVGAPVETAELLLDSGKFSVNVNYDSVYTAHRDTSEVTETENFLYIKVSDWAFGADYESDAMTVARSRFEAIKEAVIKAYEKDFVIVDLRGNPGGDATYTEEFLNYMYFSNEPKLIGPFTKNLKSAKAGQIAMTSSEILYSGSRFNKLYSNVNYDPDMYAPEYKGLEEKPCKEFPSYKGEKNFKGKLIILTDVLSASASEYFISTAQLIDEDNVILVGENTYGCISYGGVFPYYLPESGICINLSNTDFSETARFSKNKKWSGETYGFMPDYWATQDKISETLELLTGSKVLADLIR